jgi:dTDP-glucose 4,6-dehydratase
MRIIVTGGAGFIGSAFVRYHAERGLKITAFDKLTYAGNLENLAPVAGNRDFEFVQGDICDQEAVTNLFETQEPDAVVHFAAESHVDRSILSPAPVFATNLHGTFTLLEAARQCRIPRFVHVSTDEVYGSVSEPLEADERFPLQASSPYSATKAGSDLLALSYYHTYKMPVLVTRASNNYGPYQFPEKLIPLMITNALEGRPLPIYGDGMQVRDWLYVDDHARAIFSVLEHGRAGEVYNIGGSCSLPNIEVVKRILVATGASYDLIRTVADRPGHDRRYALSSAKIRNETGWRPEVDFVTGLATTVAWYQENDDWMARVRSGEYREYYRRNYEERSAQLSLMGE